LDVHAARITHKMSFVGSPGYASPEQCEMGDLDTRSDIYSLGATLWYLLTGKPPFVGNVNQVLIAHAMKLPPFGQLQGVPKPVVGLMRQMLESRRSAERSAGVARSNRGNRTADCTGFVETPPVALTQAAGSDGGS
jgi:serine/threonine protein kinase